MERISGKSLTDGQPHPGVHHRFSVDIHRLLRNITQYVPHGVPKISRY